MPARRRQRHHAARARHRDHAVRRADEYASAAVLVVETGVTSVRYDLGRKAEIYASAGVPDYWVLDVPRRMLVVHRAPVDGRYTDVRTLREDATVNAAALDLAVRVASLL